MHLAAFATLVIKNVLRSPTRLIATLGGCALAAFIVSTCLVADASLRAVQRRAGAQPNLMVHQRGRHCLATSELPDTIAQRIAALPGVALTMPVAYLETPCQSATEVTVVHGVDKHLFTHFRAFSIASDALQRFLHERTAALVGDRIAARYGWRPGQFVTLQELRGISFTIAGIFTTHGSIYDSFILLDRVFLQETLGKRGMCNLILVKPDAQADTAALAAQINALPLPVPVQTLSEQAHLSTALAQLRDVIDVSRVIQSVVVVLLLIAMGNGVAMAMRDRTREFGVLRTLGFRSGHIALLVLGEVVVLALAGALLGSLLTFLLVRTRILDTVSACGFTVSLRMTASVWLLCFATILLVAALSAAWPAWRAARLDIVNAIRKND